ncbi:hypothetical protein CYMTET_34191 [Cymbomonas tetramitiformis]|uniref:Uncharacterized protein n=1 Tax=Cymbomonas tetramitiformis TaxID=36881 RepID=A0AAE0FBL6_9CHLO|nr:hypothetical protein CYMTET_34191 [Cymbomonas tetramitiformis]
MNTKAIPWIGGPMLAACDHLAWISSDAPGGMAALDALCTGWCHKFQGGGGELTGRIWERAALARARLARMDFGMACPGVALAPIRLHVYKLPLEVGLGLWLVTECWSKSNSSTRWRARYRNTAELSAAAEPSAITRDAMWTRSQDLKGSSGGAGREELWGGGEVEREEQEVEGREARQGSGGAGWRRWREWREWRGNRWRRWWRWEREEREEEEEEAQEEEVEVMAAEVGVTAVDPK